MIEDNSTKTEYGVEVYEDIISQALDAWLSENPDVDIVKDISQYQWKSILLYIYKNYISLYKIDLIHTDNLKSFSYDFDKLLKLYDCYESICYKYNKIVMLADFGMLSGIDYRKLMEWYGDYNGKVSKAASDFVKKIQIDSEQALSTQMISSGRNPVGYMAILNHSFNWQTTAAAQGRDVTPRKPEEIAAAHGVAVESQTVEALPQAGFTQDVVPSGEG